MSVTDGRLQRNRDEAILVGVCAGLGDYFAVDATLVRAIFIAASVVGGFGPALYLVLWILLADAERQALDGSPTAALRSDEIESPAEPSRAGDHAESLGA